VNNIGLDGSGENCDNVGQEQNIEFSINSDLILVENFSENPLAVSRIKTYYKNNNRPLLIRAVNKISRILLKSNSIQ
jgi:hypothetical protein